MSTLEEILSDLSPTDRMEVEARAQELMSEEETRRELCRALEQTEISIGKRKSHDLQSSTSNGNREELLLAALNEHISDMGGKLSLIVEFEGRAPVLFTGIGTSEEDFDDGVWGSFRFDTLSARWRELLQVESVEESQLPGADSEYEDALSYGNDPPSADWKELTQRDPVENASAVTPD